MRNEDSTHLRVSKEARDKFKKLAMLNHRDMIQQFEWLMENDWKLVNKGDLK